MRERKVWFNGHDEVKKTIARKLKITLVIKTQSSPNKREQQSKVTAKTFTKLKLEQGQRKRKLCASIRMRLSFSRLH